ncbi:MAG: hypothetical protein KAV41_00045 [Candidatus Pacebacteria bacterium]|nr:hypothetical protein [Candidatus Paceibacterota bacterium]
MKYKVLITTSGIGQRLGEITKYTNKALVRVGKKPSLAYIIESYPIDTSFIITIGYFANHIKEFISLAYPDRDIKFVEIDNYNGKGSSLGYSMLQAKKLLQCPFIYHASDTIVTEKIPEAKENWIGVFKGKDASQYASWKKINGKTLIFNDKGALDFDYIHIGLVGINDYKKYWETLEKLYKKNLSNNTLNDCQVIVSMLSDGDKFNLVSFKQWIDTGNVAALQHAREQIADKFNNLDKLEESIFLFNDFVIKFFHDKKIIQDRVKRGKFLKGLVPDIEGATENFYRYKYTKGDLYANVATPSNFNDFLIWTNKNLWTKVNGINPKLFKRKCHEFYFDKTKKRIQQFLESNKIKDRENIINGEKTPSIEKILQKVDFEWLADAEPYRFHGDFILDNILKTKNGYCLIDWRHNFGGLLEAGDIYYDLSKLNHNLTVNHDIIHKNLFSIKIEKDGKINCDILRKNNLVECQKLLFDFLKKEGYNTKKVNVLTGLIWLNMSPLHHYPFNLFLYYFGKLHLWRAIGENK